MLDEKTLNEFITEVRKSYQRFSLWMYLHNKYVETQDAIKLWPDHKSVKYENVMNTIKVTLQESMILAVTRLKEDAYYKNDEKKPLNTINHVLTLLDDNDISSSFVGSMGKLYDFDSSSLRIRHNRIAHSSKKDNPKKLEAGIEEFFNLLKTTVEMIKSKYSHLSKCENIQYESIDESTNESVEQLFAMIINYQDER